MHKLLDVNLWLALVLEGHSQHQVARQWYRNSVLERGDLVFCRQTELGVLRLLTQPKVMAACGQSAFANDSAIQFIASVQSDAAVGFVAEAPATRARWLTLARTGQSAPNVWMDAYLAAMALTLEIELVTFDQGFAQYQPSGLLLTLLKDT